MKFNALNQLPQKEVICACCRLKFQDVVSYKLHRATEFHIYNTKRAVAELEPISEELFEEKKAMLANSNLSVSVVTSWKCQACSKNFKTLEQLDEHKKSKKHKKAEKDYLRLHPETSMSDIFKSIQHESSNASSHHHPHGADVDILQELHQAIHGGGSPGKDRPTLEEDDLENMGDNHVRTTLESLRICLFCNHESDGVKKNLDHMHRRHSYKILDIECLINLKGLLAYTAERIQLGKICLTCNKQFKTADRCQQHMLDKGHTMMSPENEEEFEIFYDFARQYANMNLKKKPKAIAGNSSAQEILAEAENGHDMEDERKEGTAKGEGKDKVSEDDWEDCDVEDDDNFEDVEDDEDYEVLSDSEKPSIEKGKSSTFELLDDSETGRTGKKTESFQMIGDSHSAIEGAGKQSMTESSTPGFVMNQVKKRGKTRQEAYQELDIESAELLPSGELKLANGKIIGHRDYKHVYRQHLRLPDEREAVVINKLALEYRMSKHGPLAISNVAAAEQTGVNPTEANKKVKRAQYQTQNRDQKRELKIKMGQYKGMMKFFNDPEGHLQ